jgi:hypothetical protein
MMREMEFTFWLSPKGLGFEGKAPDQRREQSVGHSKMTDFDVIQDPRTFVSSPLCLRSFGMSTM